MDKGHIDGLMGKYMQEDGLKVNNMEKENMFILIMK